MVRTSQLPRLARAVALVVGLLVALSLLVATPATAARRSENRMRGLINAERAERDRGSLDMRARLVRVARRHSRQMAEEDSLYHNQRLPQELHDYSWEVLGENVGVGQTIRRLHRAFMQSPTHRDNVLFRGFDRVGVGVVRGGGSTWVTVVFAG